MAVTSGSCYSSYGRNSRFRVDWERTGTWSDNSGCGSIIKWKLVLENGNYWYSNAIKCYAIYINGTKVSDGGTWSNYTSSGNYTLIDWQTNVRIAHNNAGNEKTFNINYTGWFYSSYNVSASTDFTLPSIPRGTSITSFTVSKRNETSLTLTWKTADAIAEVYYSTNNGTNWTKDSATNVSSGTITASGLRPNTTYQCKIKVVRNTIETFSSQVSATTNQIPTQWLSSRTETSITMGWWLDANASQIRYSSNNGSSWSSWINVSGTQGTYTISGLSAGTSYNIKTEVKRSATGTSYPTSASYQTTYNYPYVTAVGTSTMTIGNSQTLSLYNPLSRSVTVKMNKDTASGTQLYSGTTTGTSITFTPNASTLYSTIPNATSGKCVYSVVYGSVTNSTSGNYYYQVNTSACIPTFSDFAYKDTTDNHLTQAIDNNQILVQNVSSVNVVISSANKMVAKNSATASKYAATFSNLSNQNIPYSSSDIDTNLGVVTGKGNQTFKVIAYDSRNIGKEVSKAVNVIEYSAPVVNVSLERLNGYEDETHLKVTGTFSRVTVNNEDKNLIESVQYRYRETGGTWGSWVTMTILSQGYGSYQTEQDTISCDNTKQFDFEFQVTDRAKTTSASRVLSIGQPLMFLHTEGKLEVNDTVEASFFKPKFYELSLEHLSTDNFYPITFPKPAADYTLDCEIHSPNLGGAQPYNQNTIHFVSLADGWADTPDYLNVLNYGRFDTSEITIGCIAQNTTANPAPTFETECVWLRGGLKYRFVSNFKPVLHESNYTAGVTYAVGTNYYGSSSTTANVKFYPDSVTGGRVTWVGNEISYNGNNMQKLTLPSSNGDIGFRCLCSFNGVAWNNYRMTLLIQSRHQGTGILSIGISMGANNTSTNGYPSINYFGTTCQSTTPNWYLFFNYSTGLISLYWRHSDYSETKITVLANNGFPRLSLGSFVSSIPSSAGNLFPMTFGVSPYKEEERVIGSWYNDKPIYRKVIVSTTFASQYTIATGVDELVKITGVAYRKDYNVAQVIPSRIGETTQLDFGNFDFADGYIIVKWGSYWSGSPSTNFKKIIIIAEYTKTTNTQN